MHSLLSHARSACSDPDCELHQIEVGRDEATVSDADLAFFTAGAQAMARACERGAPVCGNCHRLLLEVEGCCLCCGNPVE